MNRTVCASGAILPGSTPRGVMAALAQGIFEGPWGRLSASKVQLCPQNAGWINEAMCDDLRQAHPSTEFRLHANARVLQKPVRWDAGSFNNQTIFYYQTLAAISHRLKAKAYSLHAGYRDSGSLAETFEKTARIQDLFGDIPVAIEGLYPNPHHPMLLDCWDDYDALLHSNHFMAIDLSHLQIVARTEGRWEWALVRDLLASDRCLEIHVSANNGRADQHGVVTREPEWLPLVEASNPEAVIFSEGDQVRAAKTAAKSLARSMRGHPADAELS